MAPSQKPLTSSCPIVSWELTCTCPVFIFLGTLLLLNAGLPLTLSQANSPLTSDLFVLIAADPGLIWIVIGPVICFILLLFVGGAVFVVFKKK